MRITRSAICLLCLTCLLLCGSVPVQAAPPSSEEPSAELRPRTERLLTREERDALTPAAVLQSLKEGNRRFAAGTLTQRNHSKMVRDASLGQHPKAIVLSCVDSRVPVEDVFDRGIGDIFVARVAGNFTNTDILGSMEFACRISGSKLIVVLGHEHCGAIRSAIDGANNPSSIADLGNITPMLKNLRPAVDAAQSYPGEKTGSNPKFVQQVAKENVRQTIAKIRQQSPILSEMEAQGAIKIVGGIYAMETGVVELLGE